MKYAVAVAALVASYASAQALPACGRICIEGVQQNLVGAPHNCAPGDISCFCRTPDYGYGIRDCTAVRCPTQAGQRAAILFGAQQCANAGVVGVSGLTSATGSASMTGAMSMPGGGLGLGVPITTLTTTNEAGQTFLGTVIAQTGPAGRTTGTTTLTGAAAGNTGAAGAGALGVPVTTITTNENDMTVTAIVYAQTNAAGSTTASTTVTGAGSMVTGAPSGGVVAGAGMPFSTVTTNENDMTLTEVLYAQTNSAGSTTATSTSTLGAGGAGSAITTVTTSMNGMAVTEVLYAQTNSAGSTTATSTSTLGGLGQIVTVPVTSSMTTSTGAAGGGRGTSTELVTATNTVATTTGAGATDMTGGAAMHTAAPLMGAAGIAALLLL